MKAEAERMAALGYPPTHDEKPPKFPMKFREFLRRMFGGRLHDERLHLFRKYLFDSTKVSEYYRGGHGSHQALIDAASKTTDELIGKYNREGITEPNWYITLRGDISRWRKANRIFQRQQANKSRWLKENRKKLLRLLQRRVSDLSQAEKCRLAKPKRKKVTGSHSKK